MSTPFKEVWQSFTPKARLRKLKKRPPAWLYPYRVESEYRSYINSMLTEMESPIKTLVNNPNVVQGINALTRTDAEDWNDELFRDLDNMSGAFNPADIDRKMLELFGKTDDANAKEWTKYQRSMVGIHFFGSEEWINPFAKVWVSRNHTLITSLASDVVKKVELEISNGILAGKSHKTIAKDLYGDGGVIDGQRYRATLIARDQVSKLNGALTKKRQQDGGLELYTWRDASDERVRKSHQANDGKVFDWNKPPATGHPSEDIQCRCYAEPLMIFDLTKSQKDDLIGFPAQEIFSKVA